MTCAFLGGTAGSWIGVRAYEQLGWTGVCGLVAGLAAVALARPLLYLARPSQDGRPAAGIRPDMISRQSG